MKIAQLLLQAFGPFTGEVIDFAATPANLHLIYGPNEAGKSSALRAMTDLRFGIHMRSTDDFVHKSTDLRIGGLFIDDHGALVGFVRRKGRGLTLSRFDPAKGQSEETLPILPDHERALTGGLDRAEFERMFGLNHARLREGGKLLLEGEGELGAALFEASAGTRGIAELLAELDADAKQLYNPHGGAKNAAINEARRQLDEQRQALRQAVTRPADWQALNRAHETAKSDLDRVTQELEASHRQDHDLTELRAVEPLLREHDRAEAELEALSDVPDLPENSRDERLAAEQALRRAAQDLQEAELELAHCADGLGAAVVEQALLDHGAAIDRLAAGVEAAGRSRIEAQQQQAVVERLQAELTDRAGRIAAGIDIKQILAALPSGADRVMLDNHLREMSRLSERLGGHRARIQELDHAGKRETDQAFTPPDPEARQILATALQQARALGDTERRMGELEREVNEVDSRLSQALSDLGISSADALRKAQPMLDVQILSARQKMTELDEAVRAAKDEDARLERDLEQQRLRHRELAAEGEVVTAETLRVARARRDDGWTLVRRAYVERSGEADELARSFDPSRALPEAFEAAQEKADGQADLLRADAKRAVGFEECSARIEGMGKRQQAIDAELVDLGTRREALRAAWSEHLAEATLPDLEPDALREWQAKRQAALEIAERLARLHVDRDRLRVDMNTAATTLTTALDVVGQPVSGDSLSTLIEHATQWETQAVAAEAAHRERTNAARDRRAEREKVCAQIEETESELQGHSSAVQAWHVRLFLAGGSTPDAVRARLDEFDGLAKQASDLSTARERQAHHRAVIDDLQTQASGIASLLGEPPPRLVDDFADRLRARLAVSRDQDRQRTALLRDRDRALGTKRRAEAERETQITALARLCSAAGVDTAEQLPDREDAAMRKRQARKTLAAQRQQLSQASTRSDHDLRERLSGQDGVAIKSERERCRAEIARLEQEQASARQKEEQTRRALEAIDTSDRAAMAREAMESAAARYRSAIRPWAQLRLAHALLQEALNRFRDRARGPMVEAASTYFSLMTGGRYARLVTDDTGSTPVLLAEEGDGKRKGIEALSDGTADQLYLALRLAALDLRRESHPQMPLVLDDVLITSDDERAANILRALARFSERGQVMLFTHHRHLIDVARTVLGAQALEIHSL